jgi:hypothetical protein
MYSETSAQLVAHFTHPNGWWRDMAQRLVILEQDKAVVPALKQLMAVAAAAPPSRPAAASALPQAQGRPEPGRGTAQAGSHAVQREWLPPSGGRRAVHERKQQEHSPCQSRFSPPKAKRTEPPSSSGTAHRPDFPKTLRNSGPAPGCWSLAG